MYRKHGRSVVARARLRMQAGHMGSPLYTHTHTHNDAPAVVVGRRVLAADCERGVLPDADVGENTVPTEAHTRNTTRTTCRMHLFLLVG